MNIIEIISGNSVLHTLIYGTIYYIFIVVLLRVSGKRSLSKLNSFDFIVTIALGSIFATVITDKSISLVAGLAMISILVVLQFIITFLSSRFDGFNKMIKSEPTLVFYKGEFLKKRMKKERVAEDEIMQAVKNSGSGSMEEVAAVVLETNGTFSIVKSEGELLKEIGRSVDKI